MGGPRDDFLDALTYRVKEEVITNYLRERLILEEEIKEYQQALEEYQALAGEVKTRKIQLACLLVNEGNYREFFRLLGFRTFPLEFLENPEIDGPPACPLGLSPRGFTQKGRYLDLVIKTYGWFFEKYGEASTAMQELLELADDINQDIASFHANFDLMAIINFLKSLDIAMEIKKKFMGTNFTAAELGSIEQKMLFHKLDPHGQGLNPWPELPAPESARRLVADFVNDIFRSERELIIPALGKK